MKTKLLIAIFTILLFAACASPNDYDYHSDDSDSVGHTDSHPDTIQGRAPDSTNAITDSTNVGIGDTTLEQTH